MLPLLLPTTHRGMGAQYRLSVTHVVRAISAIIRDIEAPDAARL